MSKPITTAGTPGQRRGPVTLPGGWQRATLSELVTDVQAGFAVGERDPKGMIQLRMNNVTKSGTWDWSSFIRVPADKETKKSYVLQPGDVLFNNTNSTEMVGKSALFEGHQEPIVFSNHFTRIRSNTERLLPEFLSLWLLSRWQKGDFARQCDRWIGQSAIQRNKLLALELPLPPVAEQRRIAGRLREQLAAVAQARAAVQAQLDAAHALPAAHLRAVFNSPTAQRWPRRKLDKLCDLLPSKAIALSGDTEVRAITSACLTETGFNPEGVKTARMWAAAARDSIVSRGEILIARSNTPEWVGRVSIYGGEPKGIVASDLTVRLWPRDQSVGSFLASYLSSLFVSGYWKDRAGGASGTMKKITRAQIESEQVPAPSFAEQQLVADKLEAELEAAANAKNTLQDRLTALDHLPATLLREAFGG